MAEVTELKASMPAMEEKQKTLAAELDKELAEIPNMPLDDVPDGTDASGNVEHHRLRQEARLRFQARSSISNWAKRSARWISRLAAKLSGARFVVLKRAWRGSSARSGNSCSICIRAGAWIYGSQSADLGAR